MAYCKGEGKFKSQIFLKIRTFNFAINDFYSFKISEALYHKRYFDVWGAEKKAKQYEIIPVRDCFRSAGLNYIKTGIKA